jgi:hypothetical protein
MLSLVVSLKGLIELLGVLVLAQEIVRLISFGRHQSNPVFRLLTFFSRPVMQLARWISPRLVIERHLPAVALLMLAVVWFCLVLAKAYLSALGATGV